MSNPYKPSTRIQGLGTFTIALNTTQKIDPKNLPAANAQVAQPPENNMLQFVVSNESSVANGAILYIAGIDGLFALAVLPQTVVTLESDSVFIICNPSGTSNPNGVSIASTVGLLLTNSVRSPGQGARSSISSSSNASNVSGSFYGGKNPP